MLSFCGPISVFLKVGGIARLGAILMSKGAIEGRNNAKGAKILIDKLTSVAYTIMTC